MNTIVIQGDRDMTKGRLKQKWASLTGNDLLFAEGRKDKVVGRVQKRTGETREAFCNAIKDAEGNCGCD